MLSSLLRLPAYSLGFPCCIYSITYARAKVKEYFYKTRQFYKNNKGTFIKYCKNGKITPLQR
jgi:hypothetical protein